MTGLDRLDGDSLDDELDFYRDDDDVAVLFIMEDGSKVWCLGNIEETSVAKGTVDERRALGGNGPAYLLGLDKVYKPNGVYSQSRALRNRDIKKRCAPVFCNALCNAM